MKPYERIVPDFADAHAHLIAYCKARDLAPGDVWITHEYSAWEQAEAATSRKLKRAGEQSDNFTEWLAKKEAI